MMRPRIKVKKSVPDPALSFEGLPPRTLPPVLTAAAVAKGLMPPVGVSALPPSLEAATPLDLRYWTAKTAEEARAVRDELVERAVFTSSCILKVDNDLRLVSWQAFLVEVEDGAEPATLAKRTDVQVAGAMRLAASAEPVLALAVPGALEAGALDAILKETNGRVCVSLDDSPENRAAVSKLASVFTLETRPGVLYASPLPLDAEATHVVSAKAEKSHAVRFVRKAEESAEERYVFGVVLEPDVVDSQNDTYSAAEVRKAAHRFMEQHAQLGKQHAEIVTGQLKILESYVAPTDFSIGEQTVKAGTWLLGIRVVSDELWTAVKSGSYTGFSIGGTAIRQPTEL